MTIGIITKACLLKVTMLLMASAAYMAHASAQASWPPADLGEARDYFDNSLPEGPEGVWIYPDDNVIVAIAKKPEAGISSLPVYDIVVVQSADVRLSPGLSIGNIEASPDPSIFKMTLFTGMKNGLPAMPSECLATLDANKEIFLVKGKKLKIKLNPFSFLPRFWRIARLSIDNPLDKLPSGMIRLFPSYDDNGSSRRSPRTL